MKHYVALIRGINVGGKNRVAMQDLRNALETAGLGDVSTYIQSGNVFCSSDLDESRVARIVADTVAAEFDVAAGVVVRTCAEIRDLAQSHPFETDDPAPANVHVFFLGTTPTTAQIQSLDPDRSPPDRYVVTGREVIALLPQGAARTKLTIDYFGSRLGTQATARNWKTVQALALRCEPPSP